MAITQSLGRVSVIPRGEYNETTQYEKLDLIKFRGSSFIALKTTVGNLPTDENYFQLIAEKGDTGETGPTGQTGERGLPGRDVSSIVMTNEGVNHPITAIYSDGTEQAIGNIKDGSGGDMYTAIYDIDGDGVVDRADVITDGNNTITPTDVINKANKSDVYTKTEVDGKIPFVGDKYNSSYKYSKDDLCIEGNIVYKSLVNNNIGNAVTNTNYFTPTTLRNEFGTLKNTLNSLIITEQHSKYSSSVSSGNYGDVEFNIAKEGYILLGVIRYAIQESGGKGVINSISVENNSKVKIRVYNADNSNHAFLVYITALYAKNNVTEQIN